MRVPTPVLIATFIAGSWESRGHLLQAGSTAQCAQRHGLFEQQGNDDCHDQHNGAREYQIALYFVDWKKQRSRQVVEMMDADSLNPISPVRMVSDHSDGIYLIYKYDHSVKFRISKVRGDVLSLSGIFCDHASPVSMIKDSTI